MLRVDQVHVHYSSAHVLQGVSLGVRPAQVVCLVGRNGAGKTTALKAIIGLVRLTAGSVHLEEARIDGQAAHTIARLGVAYVPEDRRTFGSLSVEENVRVAAQAVGRSADAGVREALAFFPDLLARKGQRAGSLSGGQQQMLAIARALVVQPRVMLLDEPTEGLAPSMVQSIREAIVAARERRVAVLLVEQNLNLALAVGDYFFVMSRGRVAYQGTRDALLKEPEVIAAELGVGRIREAMPWAQ